MTITSSQAALFGIYGYGAFAATIAIQSRRFGVSITLVLPAHTYTPDFENEPKRKPTETMITSGSGYNVTITMLLNINSIIFSSFIEKCL